MYHEGVTALIPAAGLGTRMVPATKEIPKEMLPIPDTSGGRLLFKPFIQVVFESLYNAGIRTFVFVVGRGKRILQDHFVVDKGFEQLLRAKGKTVEADALARLHAMVEGSTIIWVDQPEPRGLGDAVLRGLRAVTTSHVLVHLGDILAYNPNHNHISDLLHTHENLRGKCSSGLITLIPVEDPRSYGVAVPDDTVAIATGPTIEKIIIIKDLLEKPKEPPSNLAVAGIYLLDTQMLQQALQKTPTSKKSGELELTDALARMAREGWLCGAVARDALYIDIGRPNKYLQTINMLTSSQRGQRVNR